MLAVIPPGDPKATVIAGKKQGWQGLPINYGQTEDLNHPGHVFPTMTTAWEPTPDELAALNAGAKVIVQIIGTPPINPMAVTVGEPIDTPPLMQMKYDAPMLVRCVKAARAFRRINPGNDEKTEVEMIATILRAAGLEAVDAT